MAIVETLTGTDMDFGKVLWNVLRRNNKFRANGALWLLQPEAGEWHFVIATPRVDEVGPRKAYEELSQITRQIAADSSTLLKIELISPRQPFYEALRSVFGNTASVEGARLGGTQIGGRYINDAYLYEIR
ncbi:MAG: hypothetical protein WAL52_16095 [Candidatus Sulfotelmatobacter sp.]